MTCSKGQASGGLAVLFSVDFNLDIQAVDTSCPSYIQTLLIKNKHMDTLVCFDVYLPAESSKFQGNEKLWDQLHITFERYSNQGNEKLWDQLHITSQYPNSKIILCGDFNARIGPGNIGSQINTNILVVAQVSLLDRNLMDPTINKFGPQFLMLLYLFNLWVKIQ